MRPLPRAYCSSTNHGGDVVPEWVTDRDRPWLRELLLDAESAAAAARTFAWLAQRWRKQDGDRRAGRRARMAHHVLLEVLRAAARPPARTALRAEVYEAAARGGDGARALAEVAARHGLDPAELRRRFFDDLPGRRLLRWPQPAPTTSWLLLAANRALVQGLLRDAVGAHLRVHGAARPLLRAAWLHGLRVETEPPRVVGEVLPDAFVLRWERSDARSWRPLAALLGVLPWARRFELRAQLRRRDGAGPSDGQLVVDSHDEILPGPEPRAFDSELERSLVRDLHGAEQDWELLREPAPLAIPTGLGFPDFELRHRPTGERWLVEIAGLRDAAALPQKLSLLAAHERLFLCLPRRHVPPAFAGHPRIVPFGASIAAAHLLQQIAAYRTRFVPPPFSPPHGVPDAPPPPP